MGETAHIAWKTCKILWFVSFYSVRIITLLVDLRKTILLFLVFNYSVNRCNTYWVAFTTNTMGGICMLEELQPGGIWWLTPNAPRPGMSPKWRGWLGGLQTLFWWEELTFPPWSWSTGQQVLFLSQWSPCYSGTLIPRKKWLPGIKKIFWVIPGVSNTQLQKKTLWREELSKKSDSCPVYWNHPAFEAQNTDLLR